MLIFGHDFVYDAQSDTDSMVLWYIRSNDLL